MALKFYLCEWLCASVVCLWACWRHCACGPQWRVAWPSVLTRLVVVSRLMMVMGGSVVVGGGLMVVLGGWVFLVCHVRLLPWRCEVWASAVNVPVGHLVPPTHDALLRCRVDRKVGSCSWMAV